MNEPKVGEYWYAGPDANQIVYIEKVVGTGYYNDEYYVSTLLDSTRCNRSWLKAKWKPNWFWKLLGYV